MFLTDGFATVGPEISGCDDVILTVGARNESRVLILMSALTVNYGTAKRLMIWRPRGRNRIIEGAGPMSHGTAGSGSQGMPH